MLDEKQLQSRFDDVELMYHCPQHQTLSPTLIATNYSTKDDKPSLRDWLDLYFPSSNPGAKYIASSVKDDKISISTRTQRSLVLLNSETPIEHLAS